MQERESAQDKFLKQTIEKVQATHELNEDVLKQSQVVDEPMSSVPNHAAIQVCIHEFHYSRSFTSNPCTAVCMGN